MSPKVESLPLEGLPSSVNNRSLFTDYYLIELLKDDLFFQRSKAQAREAWKSIKAQYEKVKELLPTANEAETERRFIRPVLNILGYKDLYSLQPSVPSPEGIRRPDFAFFTSQEDLEEAEKHLKGKPEYFSKTLAVGDAKQWERSLDKKLKGAGDPFTNQNPSYQIDFYLRATDRIWGILANGRHWRLYHRDTSYRMDVFYEIDLLAMLEEYDDSFLYFYAFFCREALTSGFLDRALKQSQAYVAKLSDELKENVYEALRLLAEGFLKFPGNGLSKDGLEEIRANTFVFIYRLLFLFYAEDRALLPLENPNYRSYSLRELAKEIAERLDKGQFISPTTQGYWTRLHDLFRIVNSGDDSMGVPPYNGGLFDESKHPFLESYKVGDSYVAQALDWLARTEASERTGRGPVSYRDLEIRHIGGIYEGLLEHRLRIADREVAVVKEKGREKFIPIAELNGRKPLRTYQAGEVYLETDRGERKATGSYYTPHYIVQYIVRNTLGPVIKEKREDVEAARKELEEKFKRSRGYNREVYGKQLHEIGNRLIDGILSIKVLDPAMGSGHFLVEATDFLAKELIRALGESPRGGRRGGGPLGTVGGGRALHLRRRSEPPGGGAGQAQPLALHCGPGPPALFLGSSPAPGEFSDRVVGKRFGPPPDSQQEGQDRLNRGARDRAFRGQTQGAAAGGAGRGDGAPSETFRPGGGRPGKRSHLQSRPRFAPPVQGGGRRVDLHVVRE